MKKFRLFGLDLTLISFFHYIKLIFRSLLFIAAAIVYIINRVKHTGTLFGGYENKPIILGVIWLVFVIEMLLRFFPSRVESMGCRKQFAKNYIPTGKTQPLLQSNRVTILIALGWLAFNGIFGALYLMKIMDKGMMVLLSLAFSVCDLICILFFCPFQTWFMKNKCCVSCRIYNWDYAMMFTPLLFIGGLFAWSLLAIAVALLLHWEYAVYKYPERFSENTNDCLSCKNCPEKLCRHKKQLQKFLKKNRALLRSRGTKLWK